MMRVLVLGADGFIGRRIVSHLQQSGWAIPMAAAPTSSITSGEGVAWVATDRLGPSGLREVLQEVSAVVTCHGEVTARGTDQLIEAARAVGGRRIVHLSSMAVYGRHEGLLAEDSPLDPELNWYSRAMCKDEARFTAYASEGHTVWLLRLACVHGPGSEMWVGRIGRLLRSGRLGDIGKAGDGWANLVHVDDVCAAVLASLQHAPCSEGRPSVLNVAGADNPRWNTYFSDLAERTSVLPLRYLGERRLKFDAYLLSPFLKMAEIAARRLGQQSFELPEPLPPSLLALWRQQIRLDVSALRNVLGVLTMPYEQSLEESAEWFNQRAGSQPVVSSAAGGST